MMASHFAILLFSFVLSIDFMGILTKIRDGR